jgi:hypothetical protein
VDEDWTVVALKTYFEQRFIDSQRAVDAALASAEKAVTAALSASEKAVDKAEKASGDRMEAHNQLQKKLDLQAQTLADKDWVSDRLGAISGQVTILEQRISRFENREEGMGLTAKLAIGALGCVVSLVGLIATLLTIYFAVMKFKGG